MDYMNCDQVGSHFGSSSGATHREFVPSFSIARQVRIILSSKDHLTDIYPDN